MKGKLWDLLKLETGTNKIRTIKQTIWFIKIILQAIYINAI